MTRTVAAILFVLASQANADVERTYYLGGASDVVAGEQGFKGMLDACRDRLWVTPVALPERVKQDIRPCTVSDFRRVHFDVAEELISDPVEFQWVIHDLAAEHTVRNCGLGFEGAPGALGTIVRGPQYAITLQSCSLSAPVACCVDSELRPPG